MGCVLLMTLKISLDYSQEVLSLFHLVLFFAAAYTSKEIKLIIILCFILECQQYFISYRSFEIVDLLCNLVGCLVADRFILVKNTYYEKLLYFIFSFIKLGR